MSTNEQYEEPSKHIVSIGNHEKGIEIHFFAPHNEMKCVLCIKESYSKGKRSKFSHLLTVRLGADGPDRKILRFC